ncbi:hypothetical protein [Rhodococcus sp. O3]|uniref:hypothetical protein n=1 Tax=Rhodococcus sp. O3 TaxID=3404919 RepID=UPI003B67777A
MKIRALALAPLLLLAVACGSSDPDPAPSTPDATPSMSSAPAADADGTASNVVTIDGDAAAPKTTDTMCAELLPMFETLRQTPGYNVETAAEQFLTATMNGESLPEDQRENYREAVRAAATGEC